MTLFAVTGRTHETPSSARELGLFGRGISPSRVPSGNRGIQSHGTPIHIDRTESSPDRCCTHRPSRPKFSSIDLLGNLWCSCPRLIQRLSTCGCSFQQMFAEARRFRVIDPPKVLQELGVLHGGRRYALPG